MHIMGYDTNAKEFLEILGKLTAIEPMMSSADLEVISGMLMTLQAVSSNYDIEKIIKKYSEGNHENRQIG